MEIHLYELTTGIQGNPAFVEKGLCEFSVNPGIKCGHGCLYCSAAASNRMHRSFIEIGLSPYDDGFAIVDPTMPDRVARDAKKIFARDLSKRGRVMMSTTVDPYAPEAVMYKIARKCLLAILEQPGWTARILTKNVAVADDFDVIQRYKDRVQIGLSITATPDKSDVIKVIEPYASPIEDRLACMRKAHELGLETYGMLCPLLPGIASDREQIEELVQEAVKFGATQIFAEGVNARASCLRKTQEALEEHGYLTEAAAVSLIRNHRWWSLYMIDLVRNVQAAVRAHFSIKKLRFLLYASDLSEFALREIRRDPAGIVWL